MAVKESIQRRIEWYLVSCINADCLIESELKCSTLAERIAGVVRLFELESHKKNAVDWLQGLPSSLEIEFFNADIWKLMTKWGILKFDPSSDKLTVYQENKLYDASDEYFKRLGAIILKWHKDFVKNGNCKTSAKSLINSVDSIQ